MASTSGKSPYTGFQQLRVHIDVDKKVVQVEGKGGLYYQLGARQLICLTHDDFFHASTSNGIPLESKQRVKFVNDILKRCEELSPEADSMHFEFAYAVPKGPR